jgi:hypothetical protein
MRIEGSRKDAVEIFLLQQDGLTGPHLYTRIETSTEDIDFRGRRSHIDGQMKTIWVGDYDACKRCGTSSAKVPKVVISR